MNAQLNDAIALARRGIELAGQQRLDEALASLDGAIALRPDFIEALLMRGIVLFDLGRFEEAVASYDRVLALQPDAQAFHCRGTALYSLGRFDEAVASYDRALALGPDADAFDTRGAALYKLGRLDEAVASYDRALALGPDAEVFTRRGAAMYDLGRFDEALASYDRALALQPDYVQARNSRGAALENLRRHDEALASYDRALALKPDHAKTHWNRSLVVLRMGDLKRGFQAYRWRFQANEAPPSPFTCPEWQGEPITGKRLVIFHEQGLGDTLQFVRYAPMAAALGAQVTLFVPSALVKLLRASLPDIEVANSLPKDIVFDYQAPMLCLPAVFGTTLDTVPARTPYLLADPTAAADRARRLQALPGCKVGLVWAGGKKIPNADARRSLKLAQFAPLADIPGVQFVSLQLGEPAGQAKTPPAGLQLIDWTAEIGDYADTAALVANLDLVITVDTSVAHLAGALGKPVWILSRYDGCWRWLLNRGDSPWYPTARLFHQPAMGDWQSVITEVTAALQAFSAPHA